MKKPSTLLLLTLSLSFPLPSLPLAAQESTATSAKTTKAEAKALPAISAEDRANYLEADREAVRVMAQLQASPLYQAAVAASQKRNVVVQQIYKKYGVDAGTPLCDGPGAPPCEGVSAGELVFRDAPKKEEPKK